MAERFSLRRVNPFLGAVAVVKTDAGRAVSADGRELPASAFPALTLRTDWPEAGDRQLVEDYIAWLAPYLLTLMGLGDALRGRLEAWAVRRAVLMDDLCNLYPRVARPGLLKRARVEAGLRRANA